MSPRWKAFFAGVGGTLLAALSLILILRRRSGGGTANVEKQVEATRERLRVASDEALAALFNKRVRESKKKGTGT